MVDEKRGSVSASPALDRELLEAKFGPPPPRPGLASRRALVARAVDSGARVVAVTAPAGYGKSTLLAEAGGRFAARSFVAPCVRMGGTQIPLAPLATLLRRLRRTEPELLDAVPLLADWIRPGSDVLIGHHDVLAATGDLVVAAAEAWSPLLIAVEDAHWADAATWDLVEYLARSLVDVPVVVAVTYRTADAEAGGEDMTISPGALNRLHGGLTHFPGRPHRRDGAAVEGDGGAEAGQNSVAQKLVDRAVLVGDDLRELLQMEVQHIHHGLGRVLLAE